MRRELVQSVVHYAPASRYREPTSSGVDIGRGGDDGDVMIRLDTREDEVREI
jgi:hypothetical protein